MKRVMSRARLDSDLEPSSGLRRHPPRKRSPQIGLSTLLLATACIAAWGSAWLNQRRIDQLEQRLSPIRSLARELVIKDREHLAVVQQQPELYDQQIWHVYVPSDSLGLHLVTREIAPHSRELMEKYAGPIERAPLSAGRHVVELKCEFDDQQWLTQVFVDDKAVISVREPKEWNWNRGSSGGGNFAEQADIPPGQPAVLFSRTFMLDDGNMGSKPPTGPANGIFLWIDELAKTPLRP